MQPGTCSLFAQLLSLKVLQVDSASWYLGSLQPSRTSRCWKHLLEDVDRQIHGEVGVEGRALWAEGQWQASFTRGVILQNRDLDTLQPSRRGWCWQTSTGYHEVSTKATVLA